MEAQTTTPAAEVAAPVAQKARQIKVAGTPTKKDAPAKTKAPIAVKAKPERKAAAPKVNQHVEAKVSVGDYSGVSSMINNNRKALVMVTTGRATGSLTERMQKSLYALRKAYGGKAFGAKGFDNGVLRDLLAAGLIRLSGGTTEVIDGKTYHQDGATALMVTITAAGQNYGKVA